MNMRAILWILLAPAIASGQELAPWKSNRHPTDAPKRHVQEIDAGKVEYNIVQGGTMDGRNCRSPQGVWTPFEQTWESNRSVRMENVSQTKVVNPWLVSGERDLRSVSAIVARAVKPGMTDGEKAMALWWHETQHRFHLPGDNRELLSPVKVLNVYGHNTCGNDSICLAGLWKAAGLKVAPARLVGHCVTQVFHDDAWHLYDGDMQSIYLLRDNETIAGEQDLVRDHDLVKRTHTQGILRPQGRAGDEWQSSIYVFEGDVSGDRSADNASAMDMTLRPGESLVWRWGHTEPPKYLGSTEHKFTERICNGLWEYRPDFSRDSWRAGADSVEAIIAGKDGLRAEEGKVGQIVWTIRTPYVLVGGKLMIEGKNANFELSWDGKTWEKAGNELDAFFPSIGTARYAYHLRCKLAGDARLGGLKIVNDLQMAPLSLPEMGVGENRFTYSDESPRSDGAAGQRRVRITHEWVERSASAPPAAPAAPIRPVDRGESTGTNVVFQWEPAVDPDGDAIADYHFELSSRPDMRWPLSMSFAKLISRTSDAGSARFTLAAPGELNPDREYYWHVRAKDAKGVWGPWSRTWRFTPRGPAPPVNVALHYDGESNLGLLQWQPNPLGRKPAAYRIYASDEKGFSVSDTPQKVAAGVYDFRQQAATKAPTKLPANFLAETQSMEFAVVGPSVESPAANKAFYRVVAVDEQGNRSGPSDYAAAPRPVVFNRPVARATAGQEFRGDIRVIRSLGDVRTRVVDGRETMNYWDVEQPRFKIEHGPAWLSIDEFTGRLSGKPEQAGTAEVVVAVALERAVRQLDPAQLQWGNEKALDQRIERVGATKQKLTIEISP